MLFRRFYDADDGGGSGDALADGGGAQIGGSKAGSGGVGANDGSTKPDSGKPVDYEAFYNQHKESVAKLPELEKEIDSLKKTNGTIGNKLGSFKKIEDRIKTDPKGFIETLAAEHQLKVKFGDTVDFGDKDITEMTPEERKKYIAFEVSRGVEEHKLTMSKEFAMIQDHQMQTKYEDWEDQKAARENVRLALMSGEMTHAEVHHLALRGANMPKILEAHKEQVIAEYQAELQKKGAAGQHGGGTRPEPKPGQNVGDSQLDLSKPQGREALQRAAKRARH